MARSNNDRHRLRGGEPSERSSDGNRAIIGAMRSLGSYCDVRSNASEPPRLRNPYVGDRKGDGMPLSIRAACHCARRRPAIDRRRFWLNVSTRRIAASDS
jgi:hypothetical protein